MLCKYKDIFGKPNEGAHSYRFLGIAIVDFMLTLIGAIIIAAYFKYDYIVTIIVTFIIGILVHRIFCVDTALNSIIFDIKTKQLDNNNEPNDI